MKKLKSIFLLLIVCLNLVFLPSSEYDISTLHADCSDHIIEELLGI